METSNPTSRVYADLTAAYAFFNARLFEGILPHCLITMQRKAKAYGYFAGQRFGNRDGAEVTDEIALNPTHFRDRTAEQTLSTLVHEMVHLQQHHFGKPSRTGYHNKQWATMMQAVGLIPSDTGAEGGKTTGQRVSHYIEAGGRYARACADLIEGQGGAVPYVELWSEGDATKRKTKAASKTKFTCPGCAMNAWGKPDIRLVCGDCDMPMAAEDNGA